MWMFQVKWGGMQFLDWQLEFQDSHIETNEKFQFLSYVSTFPRASVVDVYGIETLPTISDVNVSS